MTVSLFAATAITLYMLLAESAGCPGPGIVIVKVPEFTFRFPVVCAYRVVPPGVIVTLFPFMFVVTTGEGATAPGPAATEVYAIPTLERVAPPLSTPIVNVMVLPDTV